MDRGREKDPAVPRPPRAAPGARTHPGQGPLAGLGASRAGAGRGPAPSGPRIGPQHPQESPGSRAGCGSRRRGPRVQAAASDPDALPATCPILPRAPPRPAPPPAPR
jgi:hypothetical protein